jgi:uncharacterized protein (TIGR02246 family)
MTEHAEQIAAEIIGQLERAWNAGDGDAWGALFAEDADFVTVRGQYFRGRATIAEGHRFIFRTIYKDSTNRIELMDVRPLGDALLLAHVQAKLSVPAGPMAGEHRAIMSMVLSQAGGQWLVDAFHNTFRVDEPLGGVRGMEHFPDRAAGGPA